MPRHPEYPETAHHRFQPDDPLTCESAAGLLEAHADGDLAGEPGAALAAHLERCPACREELAAARKLADSLRSLPTLTCPPRVTEAVLAAAARDAGSQDPMLDGTGADVTGVKEPGANVSPFRAPRQATPEPSHLWRPALAAAVLAAAIGAAFLFQDRTTPPREELAQTVTMTPEEIAQTEIEVKLALAYLTEVGREAGVTVRDEMVANVVLPTHRALR